MLGYNHSLVEILTQHMKFEYKVLAPIINSSSMPLAICLLDVLIHSLFIFLCQITIFTFIDFLILWGEV